MSFNLNNQTAPFRAVTDTTPIDISIDGSVLWASAGGGTITANLPALATVRGRVFEFYLDDNADNVVLTPNGAETINGAADYTLAVGAGDNAAILYAPTTGTDWWVLAQSPT